MVSCNFICNGARCCAVCAVMHVQQLFTSRVVWMVSLTGHSTSLHEAKGTTGSVAGAAGPGANGQDGSSAINNSLCADSGEIEKHGEEERGRELVRK